MTCSVLHCDRWIGRVTYYSGIGSQLVQPNCRDSNTTAAATSVEPLSIYVSRLPKDITQDELG